MTPATQFPDLFADLPSDPEGECPTLYERCEHCLQYVEPGEPVRGRSSQILASLTGPQECSDEAFAVEEIPAHRFCQRIAARNFAAEDQTADFMGGLYRWLDQHLAEADRDLCYAYAFRLNEISFEEAWDDDACVIAQIVQHRFALTQAPE